MPNWCENTFQIFAKDETITWIENNMNANLGRRWDDADITRQFEFVQGNHPWFSLLIDVRTAYGPPDFLITLLKKFKDIHIKGYFWIEGGMGAADYEMGTDKDGKGYEIYKPINQDYGYGDVYPGEDYYEFPQRDESEWDEERIQQPHYRELEDEEDWWQNYIIEEYGDDGDCIRLDLLYLLRKDKNTIWWYVEDNNPHEVKWWEKELDFVSLDVEPHDVWKDIEAEMDESDVPCEGEEIFDCLRIDYPAIFQWADDFGIKIINDKAFDFYEGEISDRVFCEAEREYDQLLQDIPTEDELEFDQCRTDHQDIFAIAKEMDQPITNVEQYERNERDLNQHLVSEQLYQVFLEEQELLGEVPTEDELLYDQIRADEVGDECLITGYEKGSDAQDRMFDFLHDQYRFHSIGWSPDPPFPGGGIPALSGMGYIRMFNKYGEILYEDEWIDTEFFRILYEHDISEQMEEEEQTDFFYDSDSQQYGYGLGEWWSYNEWIQDILECYIDPLLEEYQHEEDYKDCVIYLDDREEYDSEEDEIISHFEYDEWRDMKYKMRNKLLYHQHPV